MIRRILTNALIACITVLLTLAVLEAAVRVIGDTDADGQFTFMGYALEPYALPIKQLRDKVTLYFDHIDRSPVIYDAMLGWTYRPNKVWQAGTFTTNSAGLRSRREYSEQPLSDTLRIALFGDSFTAGDEAVDDKMWGHQLERKLDRNHGIRAEVLNFGVGGYGIDQAFLKWQHQGRQYSPDMVIFGFQSENLDRNVNIFRHLYWTGTSSPFTKPRFVLTNHGLELINSPTIRPEQTIAVYQTFENHPLVPYERHYQSSNAARRWWVSSRLAGFMFEVLKPDEDYGPASERRMLGQAIVDAFAADVMASEAAFLVLHLPRQSELRRYHNNQTNPWQSLLDHFDSAYHYIPTEEYIDQSYVDDVYWASAGHYGTEIHDIVAQTVAAEIQACIESAACDLPRFEDRAMFIYH